MIFEIKTLVNDMFMIVQQPKEIARGNYDTYFRFEGMVITVRSRAFPESNKDTLYLQGRNPGKDDNNVRDAERWIPRIKEWCKLEGLTFMVDGQIAYTPKILGELE